MGPGDLVAINVDYWYGFSAFPGNECFNKSSSFGVCIRAPYKRFRSKVPGLTEEETVIDVYICGRVLCVPKSYCTRVSLFGG